MITTVFALALFVGRVGETAAPIRFDAITLEAAAQLDGQRVTITFAPGRPAYTWCAGTELVTVAGPDDTAQFERTVILEAIRKVTLS